MVPDHVLRPSDSSWTPAWGARATPNAYSGNLCLEVGALLKTQRLGASVAHLAPGKRACPLHDHAFEEELFYVLEGTLTVRELDVDADAYREFSVHPGEIVVYPPGTGVAHQSHNRTDAPVRYICLSSGRHPAEICRYPDSGKTMVRGVGVGVLGGDAESVLTAARSAADQRRSSPIDDADRPAWVGTASPGAQRDLGGGMTGQPLARMAGATQVFMNVDRLQKGVVSSPAHWHAQDEELVWVRAGAPVLREVEDGEERRTRLQPGDWVSFAAGRPIAHQFLADEGEVELIVIGTHRADDVVHYPEQGRIEVRQLGVTDVLQSTDYFDGEDPRG